MNVWVDATGSIGPYLWAIVLGGILGGVVCGVPGHFICRLLRRKGSISPYYDNKISGWSFSGGMILGALAGMALVWLG